jgi:hypothetical protein
LGVPVADDGSADRGPQKAADRTPASPMTEMGISPLTVKKILNHGERSSTARAEYLI